MENQIKRILNDLYKIDKELRQHEEKLIKIIKELLVSRPDTKFDSEFAVELRAEVLKRAYELKKDKELTRSWTEIMNLGKLTYALAGATLAVLIILPVVVFINRSPGEPTKLSLDSLNIKDEVKIAKLKNNAFGPLVSGQAVLEEGGQGSADTNLAAPQAVGLGASSEIAVTDETFSAQAPKGMGGGGGLATSERAIGLPAPDIINYEYVYGGGELAAPAEKMSVYRKVGGDELNNSISGLLRNLDLGIADLGQFKNLKIQNISLVEDRDFGYMVYLDLRMGQASISTNWEKWPNPYRDCRDQPCYENLRLSINDIPANKKLVSIADKFIEEYGIDLTSYGEGEVRDTWRHNYELATDKVNFYIPDSIQVVYPLIINNLTVFDGSGFVNGIMVDINIREMKVSGVGRLINLNFEASDYEIETDTARILEFAENGGLRRIFSRPNAAKTVTLKLGTPKLSLVSHWSYDKGLSSDGEIFIPAFVFPIINKDEAQNIYQDNIIVPLVKEVLDNEEDNIIGIPEPMPLLRDGAVIDSDEVNEIETGEIVAPEIEKY